MRCDISNQRVLPALLAELLRHAPQVRRPRILGVVHAVAEARDLHLPRELAPNRLVDALGPSRPGRSRSAAA